MPMVHHLMRRCAAGLLAVFCVAVPVLAQGPVGVNIDVDFNLPGEPGTGTPTSAYTAASTQAGTWNSVAFGLGPVSLVDINGIPSGVQMSRSLNVNALTFDNGSTGNYAKLVNDGDRIDFSTTYTFTGLPAGSYTVYTYCAAPSFSTIATRITIAGVAQTVASAPTDFTFAQGSTHARHTVNLTGGPLTILAQKASINGVVNGFQIVPASVPQAAILSPSACEYVNGIIEIRGTATSPTLGSWVLAYTGGDQGTWIPIANGTNQVNNGTLGFWNAASIRPCGYTLRLVVYDNAGPPIEALRSVVAASPGDVNLDSTVNFLDVNMVLAAWGQMGP